MTSSKLILSSFLLIFLFFKFDPDPNIIKATLIKDQENREQLNKKIIFQKLKAETSIAFIAATDCFLVSDGTNSLYSIDKNNGSPISEIGPTGIGSIEAITTSTDDTQIYASDGDTWGTLNCTTN